MEMLECLLVTLSSLSIMLHSGCLVRTVCVLPVKRGSGRLRWLCVCETRSTIWSVSNAPPARSTSVWVIATFSSTRTLSVSRTSSSGLSSTTAIWCSRISDCFSGWDGTNQYRVGSEQNPFLQPVWVLSTNTSGLQWTQCSVAPSCGNNNTSNTKIFPNAKNVLSTKNS